MFKASDFSSFHSRKTALGFSSSQTIHHLKWVLPGNYLFMMLGFYFCVLLIKRVRNEVLPSQFTPIKCVKIPKLKRERKVDWTRGRRPGSKAQPG